MLTEEVSAEGPEAILVGKRHAYSLRVTGYALRIVKNDAVGPDL